MVQNAFDTTVSECADRWMDETSEPPPRDFLAKHGYKPLTTWCELDVVHQYVNEEPLHWS